MENSKDVTGMNAGNEKQNKSSMGSSQESSRSDKGTTANTGASDSTTGTSLTGSGSTLASNTGTNPGTGDTGASTAKILQSSGNESSSNTSSSANMSDDISAKNEEELARIKGMSNQGRSTNQGQSPFDATGSIAAGNSDESSESRMSRQQMEERGRERMSGMGDQGMSGMGNREGISGMGESLSHMGDRNRMSGMGDRSHQEGSPFNATGSIAAGNSDESSESRMSRQQMEERGRERMENRGGSDMGNRDRMYDMGDRDRSDMGYRGSERMSNSNQYNQYNEGDDMYRSNRGRYGHGDYGQDMTRHQMGGNYDTDSLFDRGSYMRSGAGNYDRSRNLGGSMDNDDRGVGRTMDRGYNSSMGTGYENYDPNTNRGDETNYGSYGRNSINSGSDYNRDRDRDRDRDRSYGMSNYRGGSRDHDRDDRDVWDRTGDEIRSWFGDDDAQRRRRMDELRDRMEDRNRYGRSGSSNMGDRDRSQGMSSYRGSSSYNRDNRDSRDMWERTGDEIKSWFSDDDANRRRMMEERNDRERERYDRTSDPDFNRGGYSGRGYGRSRHSSDYYRETDPYSDTSRSSYLPGSRRGSWDYERNRDSDSFGTYGNQRSGSNDPYNQRSSYGPSRSQYDPSDNDYNRSDRSGYSAGRMDIGNKGRYSDRDREDRDRNYRGTQGYNRSNAGTYVRDYDRDRRDYERERDERDFWDRAGDEVRSWFGDEEAQRRRRMDDRYDTD